MSNTPQIDEDKSKRNPKKDLEKMIKLYLDSNPVLVKDHKVN